MRDDNFLEELLKEEEQKEEKQSEAYYDLLLLQIKSLDEEIEKNFNEAEKEIEIIRNWAIKRNSTLNERKQFLEKQLESFLRERESKTIKLPHGDIKLRKLPDKVEVEDMDEFLKNAKKELITIVPESMKPNLNAIKAFIKKTNGRVPKGCKVIEGKEEFKYTIKTEEVKDNAGEKEVRTGT